MFDRMDGIMQALAKKKMQLKQCLYITVKVARQKVSKYYAEVTPMTGLHLIAAYTVHPFRNVWSSRNWDAAIDINPEDEPSYTTQYQEVCLKYLENINKM